MTADQRMTIASWPRPSGPNARALATPANALPARMTIFVTVVVAIGARIDERIQRALAFSRTMELIRSILQVKQVQIIAEYQIYAPFGTHAARTVVINKHPKAQLYNLVMI